MLKWYSGKNLWNQWSVFFIYFSPLTNHFVLSVLLWWKKGKGGTPPPRLRPMETIFVSLAVNFLMGSVPSGRTVQTRHWHQADNICEGYSVKTREGKCLKSIAEAYSAARGVCTGHTSGSWDNWECLSSFQPLPCIHTCIHACTYIYRTAHMQRGGTQCKPHIDMNAVEQCIAGQFLNFSPQRFTTGRGWRQPCTFSSLLVLLCCPQHVSLSCTIYVLYCECWVTDR